jgi:serine/threonine-protein kinase RsbW
VKSSHSLARPSSASTTGGQEERAGNTETCTLARLAHHTRRPEVWWYRIFEATPEQVGVARRFLADCLGGAPETSDAITCLSEIASNAVLHSRSARPGGQFGVRVRRAPGWLWVEVTDEGGPWRREIPGDTHGRGLQVVQMLAGDLLIGDIEIDSPARTVAFEMGCQ